MRDGGIRLMEYIASSFTRTQVEQRSYRQTAKGYGNWYGKVADRRRSNTKKIALYMRINIEGPCV